MAELADAPDLESDGQPWEFKSLYPYYKYKERGKSDAKSITEATIM